MQTTLFIKKDGLLKILRKSRSPHVPVLATIVGLDVYHHDSIQLSSEASSLHFLIKAFEGYNIELQYVVAPYRIDMYFVDFQVAVECDEKSHMYRLQLDHERQIYFAEVL
jgi:very-short-patch-repair endonuclease